jgi:hypothetical protein
MDNPDVKALEEQAEKAQKALKAERKRIRAQKRREGKTFFRKLGRTGSKLVLKAYERYERKAEDLRYKLRDPEGYEADEVVEDAEKLINSYEERLAKKGELREYQKKALVRVLTALEVVVERDKGFKRHDAQRLIMRLKGILTKLLPAFGEMEDMLKVLSSSAPQGT